MDDALINEKILDLAVQIQQIPSPTFSEGPRAEFIRNTFAEIGAKEVTIDDCGNVVTRITGRGEKPPIIVSAHLDTVFPVNTQLSCTRTREKIYGAGIGDNSLGLATLFGLYWYFTGIDTKKNPDISLASDLWLVANVGEEGLGDLSGMKAIVDRFASETTAYLVLEGTTVGYIYTRGLGVRRYRISVHTRGGHAWTDYGSPSAIHEIAELVTRLNKLDVPKEPRSSLNVGVIKGGTSVNTIAADASLELDLRSESVEILDHLAEQVEILVGQANQMGGGMVQVYGDLIGDRPAGEISADHPLVKTAIECLTREGITARLKIGSTDANVPLSRGYPAICYGLTTGGGSHTPDEYIDIKPVSQGFRILIDLIQSIDRM